MFYTGFKRDENIDNLRAVSRPSDDVFPTSIFGLPGWGEYAKNTLFKSQSAKIIIIMYIMCMEVFFHNNIIIMRTLLYDKIN